ncbi:MAG: hypothetical protein LBL83_07505, partial [Clostridiales bacterium]|nr:hypothetical protein [Clostridiales bacterium]
GYSFRFYIEGMLNDAELGKVKLLAIDGVSPTPQAIADGTYPFASDFYAVTVADREYESDRGGVGAKARAEARAENARKLIDWILSAQGQELVEKTGYAPLRR